VFNILGPLTNPAGATRQLLGVFRSDLTQTLANVLKELGSEHALVVHGAGGLDECSTLGTTFVAELKAGVIQSYELDARTFNIPQVTLAELQGGTPEVNAEILKSIFTGHKGAYRDCVLLNAGAALYVAGIAADIRSGVEAAAYGIDSGLASRKLNDWVEATNS
jgi:anthranilate phosphoribosyltransferase